MDANDVKHIHRHLPQLGDILQFLHQREVTVELHPAELQQVGPFPPEGSLVRRSQAELLLEEHHQVVE